jgi:hypothetical protein
MPRKPYRREETQVDRGGKLSRHRRQRSLARHGYGESDLGEGGADSIVEQVCGDLIGWHRDGEAREAR